MELAKRLRKLEGSLAQEFGNWSLEDQLESAAADTLSRVIVSQANVGASNTVTWT